MDTASPSLKKCPFCAETIQFEAVKCKHCGELLDPILRSARPQPTTVSPASQWSPGVAAVLSLFIPGAGQMYKGDVGAGIAWLIFTIIGYVMFFVPGLILHLICIVTAASGDPSK